MLLSGSPSVQQHFRYREQSGQMGAWGHLNTVISEHRSPVGGYTQGCLPTAGGFFCSLQSLIFLRAPCWAEGAAGQRRSSDTPGRIAQPARAWHRCCCRRRLASSPCIMGQFIPPPPAAHASLAAQVAGDAHPAPGKQAQPLPEVRGSHLTGSGCRAQPPPPPTPARNASNDPRATAATAPTSAPLRRGGAVRQQHSTSPQAAPRSLSAPQPKERNLRARGGGVPPLSARPGTTTPQAARGWLCPAGRGRGRPAAAREGLRPCQPRWGSPTAAAPRGARPSLRRRKPRPLRLSHENNYWLGRGRGG